MILKVVMTMTMDDNYDADAGDDDAGNDDNGDEDADGDDADDDDDEHGNNDDNGAWFRAGCSPARRLENQPSPGMRHGSVAREAEKAKTTHGASRHPLLLRHMDETWLREHR